MNKITIKAICLLFACISFCALNFSSCKNDDNIMINEDDKYDLVWKPGLDSNALVLNVDGVEFVLDSCYKFVTACGYELVFRSTINDELYTKLFFSQSISSLNLIASTDIIYINNKDTLILNNVNSQSNINKLELKPYLINIDSILVEWAFHMKIPKGNKIRNLKGQFYYKGLLRNISCS